MTQQSTKPLTGIRIVDFSRFFAGPYCAQLLGDLGADVVKVELPTTGDPLRGQGPPFFADNGITWYATNRNKRSITLNLQAEAGRAVARELCLQADVVLENFRPSVMARLGLDYASLSAQAPRLVYASISGFGPDGPDAELGAFDLTIQALGGYMSITGERTGAPIKLGTSAFDMLAGMNCQTAIVAALLQRATTGRGQHVTTSLLESEVAFLANAALEYLMTGTEPLKWGSEHAQQVPYKAFRTSDGWAVIGAGFQNFFKAFCTILGRDDLVTDPRFSTMTVRVTNRYELYAILDAEMLKFTTADIIASLERAGVPCARVNNMREVFELAQVQHRGLRVELDHPTYGTVPTLGPAARYSEFDITAGWTAPPQLGEHSTEVLSEWLGYSHLRIEELRATRIV
ncbi:CaiB/BaiF CoA transferase family protein [Methylobacterium sp. J-070]|uniref:CaiB/BaiF CoA transferase family protein n=1 Tax=Methylobacterium sp. J-070 TaxID=2836650 RepID=UPI001FB8F76E|nr:CaiB/BaiF CoA-transferase family protein [Methylobacterium sp. J-070]MCJ2052894.1 CoA transferase [Methylobacterium sp. J-070]